MAEQLAPCSWEKAQQHFYSSQQHHCWVCPSAAMPSDCEITAFSRRLGGEGQCPGKSQQNESKVTNGVKRTLVNMITIRIHRFLWIEFYRQWRAGASRKIYLLSLEAAIWGAAWAPAFISAAVAGSLQSDHCCCFYSLCCYVQATDKEQVERPVGSSTVTGKGKKSQRQNLVRFFFLQTETTLGQYAKGRILVS